MRNGTVSEFERPTKIAFHQPMTMKLGAGTIDALMRYTLTPGPEATRVRRVVTIRIPWSLKLVQPILARAFRTEGERTLLALKAFAESGG